jgi:hypothetical protein
MAYTQKKPSAEGGLASFGGPSSSSSSTSSASSSFSDQDIEFDESRCKETQQHPTDLYFVNESSDTHISVETDSVRPVTNTLLLDDYEKEANEAWELEQQRVWEIEQEQKSRQYEKEAWACVQKPVQKCEKGTVLAPRGQAARAASRTVRTREQQEADKARERILALQALVGIYFTGGKEQEPEPRSAVLAAIKCATKNIDVLMHTFTDKGIATELANANKAGVTVFVLVDEDQSKLKQMTECLTILDNAGVQVCNHFILY